jgi:outer membrane protein OmpA-like peptidoglycan-associated protein
MGVRGAAALATALAVAGTGCSTLAGPGAVVGAGGRDGPALGSTAREAIAGAAVGGAAGAIIGRRLDAQAERLRRELKNSRVSRLGEGIAVTFESGVLFGFDSAALRPAGRAHLRTLAASLKEEPRTEILVVGHTDSLGRTLYNLGLSERRAVAAADYLARQGVRRRRVWTSGKGEEEPLAANVTDDGRRRTRRVEVAFFASEEWRRQARREAASR